MTTYTVNRISFSGTEYYRGNSEMYADKRSWTSDANQATTLDNPRGIYEFFQNDFESQSNYAMDPTSFALVPIKL